MKTLLIILFIFITNISFANVKQEETIVPIDTLEYMEFWNSFRVAALNIDEAALTSMIELQLWGDCFSYGPYYDKNYGGFSPNKKITNQYLIKHWNDLFIPVFKGLLERYNLKEDLYSESFNFEKKYQCDIVVDDKSYSVSTDFKKEGIVVFSMGFSIDNEHSIYIEYIELIFIKREDGTIKLNKIECSQRLTMC
ncbi:hypothetical protein M2138_001536 [Dysgonomonadaceae bacterium PH5-43]|nr:hypothetical protein [Dysgonomonadaceae bacterium PH5-43]